MKEIYGKYIRSELHLTGKEKLMVFCLTTVFGGMFGMIYETIFYVFNNHALCRRGSCFGPWIDIYGIGAMLIYFLCKNLKKKPWAVFLVSGLCCGTLEFVAGYLLFHLGNGKRGWNYNTEILNWGNIDGFICARSVLFFAASGLFLIYVVYPFFLILSQKVNQEVLYRIALVFTVLFFADVVYNDLVSVVFDKVYCAADLYKNIGWYEYYNEELIILGR